MQVCHKETAMSQNTCTDNWLNFIQPFSTLLPLLCCRKPGAYTRMLGAHDRVQPRKNASLLQGKIAHTHLHIYLHTMGN